MSPAFKLKPTQYRNFQQIFYDAVETTRRVLKCDRVIIYDAVNLPLAKVMAESVAQEETALLGQTINNPFLDGEYLEMYCYGMSLTIDDIYASEVGVGDLSDLTKLGVKSIAVAPIYLAEQLVAFLAAHQCSSQQPWELVVIDFLAEQAKSTGLALAKIAEVKPENKHHFSQQLTKIPPQPPVRSSESITVDELAQNNLSSQPKRSKKQSKEQILIAIKKETVDEGKLENILNFTVNKTRKLLNCDRVLIFSLDEVPGLIVAESVGEQWEKIQSLIKDRSQPDSSPARQYIEEDINGKIRAWNNTEAEDIPWWYRQQLKTFQVKAGLVAPIVHGGQIWGLLVAHQCSHTRHWHEQEINWIGEIANYIGNMVEQIKIKNSNQEQSQLADVQQQLQKEKMWTKYFANVVHKIRQSLKREDILHTTVEQVHTILKCDRALVYALNHDSYGEIVAESVSSGWTKAKGTVIQDPCFEARYLEKYRDGRFRVWNNIYEAGMTGCHIEQLERLEVRANVVVPIINEDKLFGLLVVQQCSSSRQWQHAEVLWLTQIAAQVGFALDNAQLLADAHRLRQQAETEKKWTGYFTEAVQQIRQSLKTKDVYQASVREVRRVLNYDRVLVYSLNQDRYGTIVAESVAHGWTSGEGRVIQDPCFEARYLDKYRDGRVRVWHDIYQTEMAACHLEQLERLEVKANLVVPIVSQGKLFGLLVAQQCSAPRQWQQVEIDWLTQVAVQVSFALENAQMAEEIEAHTKATQEILDRAVASSANIQRTVQHVTQGFSHLSNSCAEFSTTIQKVKDLGKQLAQQSMGMTRVINLPPADGNNQAAIAEMSDKIFSLMQELFETTATIDPLFNSIKTEITTKTTSLESETAALVSGVDDFQTASQKLDKITALNSELSNLIKNTSDALETQGSTFAADSAKELASITERISQQSVTIIESFGQLGRIIA